MENPKVVTAPVAEPVTLTEAKFHARVDYTTDDTPLTGLITAAREDVEGFWGRTLHTTTYDYYLEDFPHCDFIELPYGKPLISIASLKYTDAAGVETTWDAANYFAAPVRGALALAYGVTWPSVILKPAEPIVIRYTAGHGSTGTGTLASSSTTVTGTATDFIPEVPVGSMIIANGVGRRVLTVASDTSLTVDAAWPSNLSAAAFTIEKVPARVRQAILMTLENLYFNRGDSTPAPGLRQAAAIPEAAQMMLWRGRLIHV